MNAKIPQPVHESYKRHRKEMVRQIILPIVLTSLLVVALIVLIVNLTFFQGTGDVARWAAVSTIWIVIPIMIGLLIFLALMVGLVYLMSKLLNIIPTYTGLAQDYVRLGAVYIQRAAEAIVKPVLQLNGILAGILAFFEKIKP